MQVMFCLITERGMTFGSDICCESIQACCAYFGLAVHESLVVLNRDL